MFNFASNTQMSVQCGIEDAKSVLVTIVDIADTPVYTNEEITLYRMGTGIVSASLELKTGSYKLIEFMVVDNKGQVIFVTPKEGSNRAYLVDDPLPIEFSVNENELTTVIPEVLNTEGLDPEEFGYANFCLKVVETFKFLVIVKEATDTGYEVISANLTVTHGEKTLYQGELKATVNTIEVRDGYPTYKILIEKNGYGSYTETFTNKMLKEYADTPLVVILEKSDGEWVEYQKILADDATKYTNFGFSVSIDEDLAIIGSFHDDVNGTNSGSAYIFRWNGSSWVQEAKLLASDGTYADNFGWSVSISGVRAIVGAKGDDYNGNCSGAAYIYHWDVYSWIQEEKLVAFDRDGEDEFGNSVSIFGDYAIIGSPLDDDNGKDSGSAYIFRWDGSSWVNEVKIVPSDGVSLDNFGKSVSISGDRAIVGADYNNARSAYIFKRDGTSWIQEDKLVPSDGKIYDRFGRSVSISGDRAIVGAFFDDDNGHHSGSAYLFHRVGSSWEQKSKIVASDGAAEDRFGWSVSISGNYAIAGAYANAAYGENTGSAYIFQWNGSSWVQETKLVASDADFYHYYGYSVSISGDCAMVGSHNDNDAIIGPATGSSYVYMKLY